MNNDQPSEWNRVSALLTRLRELIPESVPSTSLEALHIHDDTLWAIRHVQLSAAERDALPYEVRLELAALESELGLDDTP